ncbi:hypothetical protein F5Y04DRAFT_213036 [Hypomontagnella monticulosa]|nr:hypothetical protein F5Y04DRAFT_213036 [Hypomontagnella monticulosa]
MYKVVESLKRISIAIRTPASAERYAKAKNVNIDHFRQADEGHIEELYQKADPILKDRLLQAVLGRRRFLQYTEEHKDKLAIIVPPQQDEERDGKLFSEGTSEFADTVATPLSPEISMDDDIAPAGISDSASDGVMSDVSDSSSLRSDILLRVPPMPPMGQEGKPFECPCCYLMVEVKGREKWKRHVFSDMRPYVCTFTECKESNRLFSSRHDWYSHELAFHRRTWICISGCPERFTSESAFIAHLRVTHKDFKDTTQAEKHGAHSRELPEPKVSTCPMCGDKIWSSESIRTHIGRHQAQLGLWPLYHMRDFGDQDEQDGQEVDEEDEDIGAGINEEEDEEEELGQEGKAMKIEQREQVGSDPSPHGLMQVEPLLSYEDYRIGWICAIQTELVAAKACLDVMHENLPQVAGDENSYTFGQIGGHNIVIGSLPVGTYGPVSSAVLATDMLRSFPRIRFGVLVGIGGGAPSSVCDIRLGDVAVSHLDNGHSGVVQFDIGRLQTRTFQTVGFLNSPPRILLVALESLRAKFDLQRLRLEHEIQYILDKNPALRDRYSRPDSGSDRLYSSSYTHASNGPCEVGCDPLHEIARCERTGDDDNPAVHYGLIASGSVVVKDAGLRDEWAQKKNVICFEMGAAGLMNSFPCIVIRGICDYCDSHKYNQWEGYAAISAAVYAKALLRQIPRTATS